MKKNKMIFITMVICALFSCETKNFYELDLSVVKSDDKNLTIEITTNLPNKSTILLTVDREFQQEDDEEMYSGTIFEKDFEIVNGNLKITIPIEDVTWYKDYQKNLEEWEEVDDFFKPITYISDSIEISALFSPRRQADKGVLQKVGKNGENLAVEETDRSKQRGFKALDKDTILHIPFKLK